MSWINETPAVDVRPEMSHIRAGVAPHAIDTRSEYHDDAEEALASKYQTAVFSD